MNPDNKFKSSYLKHRPRFDVEVTDEMRDTAIGLLLHMEKIKPAICFGFACDELGVELFSYNGPAALARLALWWEGSGKWVAAADLLRTGWYPPEVESSSPWWS